MTVGKGTFIGIKEWHAQAAELAVLDALGTNEISARLGVHRDTVRRALKTPKMQKYMDELRETRKAAAIEDALEHAEAAAKRRRELIELSWQTIKDVLTDKDAPHAARIQAAVTVLKGTGELVDRQEIEHDIAEGKRFGVIVIGGDEPVGEVAEEWRASHDEIRKLVRGSGRDEDMQTEPGSTPDGE